MQARNKEMHDKVMNKNTASYSNCTDTSDSSVITEVKEMLQRLKEQIGDLFADNDNL